MPGLDWIAVGVQLVGTYLIVKKSLWCWPVLVINNILWFIYGISTDQLSIAFLNVFFAGFNVWGYLQWKKDAAKKD